MKLYTIIIYSLCICLSFMPYLCTCQQANEPGDKVVEFAMPMLPRKLMVNERTMVKDHSGKKDVEFEPLFQQQDEASPGVETKESITDAKKGSQEELDEAKEAEYFTMDYRRVKKRRPIHNKSQPSSAASP